MTHLSSPEALVPILTAEADQEATAQYVQELTEGLSELTDGLSAAKASIAAISSREVGALRMAAFAARMPAFDHSTHANEGQHLQTALTDRLRGYTVPSLDVAIAVSRLAVRYPERMHETKQIRALDGNETPIGRLGINLAVARGMTQRALGELPSIPDDQITDRLIAIRGFYEAKDSEASQRQQLAEYLQALAQRLNIDVESVRCAANCRQWLQVPKFSSRDGWIGIIEPPAGYTAAYNSVKQRAAAEIAMRRALIDAETTADAAPLPADTGDWLEIIGRAKQHGWQPTGTLPRYSSGGRDFISLEPYVVDARRYLRHLPADANQTAA